MYHVGVYQRLYTVRALGNARPVCRLTILRFGALEGAAALPTLVAAAAFVVLVVVTTVVFLPPAVVVVVTVLVVMLPLATASVAVQTCPFLIWPHLEHVTGFRALPSLVGGAGAGAVAPGAP